ncbi:transcription initiation factor IIB [Phlyctochytrium planicorne]|nr:transcription initiation factor IIB [Phlyctochytrium planicorne]
MTNVKADESLRKHFKGIQVLSERMGLPKMVLETAKQVFKRAEEEKMLKGKTYDAGIAASVLLACRYHVVARTFKELSAFTNVSTKEIGRVCRALQDLMKSQPLKQSVCDQPHQISLDTYISRISDALDLSNDICRAGLKVANMVSAQGILEGRSTISLAAASLYFAICLSNTPIPAAEVAKAAGCAASTLKNSYKIIYASREAIAKDLAMPKRIDSLPI